MAKWVHQVFCTKASDVRGTESYLNVEAAANKVRVFARKLGFEVAMDGDPDEDA